MLDSLLVECRTCDREVAGTSLTHCAVEYVLYRVVGKPLTHTCLCREAV